MRGARAPLAAAAVVAGALVGVVVAGTRSQEYEARTTLVVAPALQRSGTSLETLTETAASLVRSRAVAENVVSELHLKGSPDAVLRRLHAHARPRTALVDVSARAKSALAAQQLLQQAVVVFERVAAGRIGSVSEWGGAAGDVRAVGKPYGASGGIGALVGAVLAAAVLLVRRRPREPEPAREPEPLPEPEQASPTEPAGTIAELRRRVDAEPDEARRAELAAYLAPLEPFADAEGNLPPNLLALAEDVFGTL